MLFFALNLEKLFLVDLVETCRIVEYWKNIWKSVLTISKLFQPSVMQVEKED